MLTQLAHHVTCPSCQRRFEPFKVLGANTRIPRSFARMCAVETYGPVNPDAFDEVDRNAVPENAREVGATLVRPGPGWEAPDSARARGVKQDKIVLDLNHPLAGQNLAFEVKILDVE